MSLPLETSGSRETPSDRSRVSHYSQVVAPASLVGNSSPVQTLKTITSQGPVTIISKSLSGMFANIGFTLVFVMEIEIIE